MPQDGPRSVVYRSFFSCEDPKGAMECKTNRKSKTDSHKLDEKVGHPKKQKNLSRSFSWNGERNDAISRVPTDHEVQSPSTFQLMQISRGAEKLNQVIDTWSKDISLEKPKDIAENLLRGALNLKESLAMLGKLQEASQVMAKLKKKQKDKGGGGKLDGAGIERTTSDRFGYATQRTLEFENPRYSVDASARDCFDELREVIKESFARQNLLPKSYYEEKPYSDRPKPEFLLPPSSPDMSLPRSFKEDTSYFDGTKSEFSWDPSYRYHNLTKISKEAKVKSDFSQDLPSTSSSQSSHYFSYEFDSSDSSISKSVEMKPKAPNVIAKLMGLEDISPKRLQSYPQKYYGKDRELNKGRVIFDIDLPKPRRPPFVQKLDPQPRTLEELTETIQFKGLMSSCSPRRFEHISDISDWRRGFASDAPPIVIIKPLHVSELKEEVTHRPKLEGSDNQKMLRKRKMKSELPPRPNNGREGALKSTEICKEVRAEKSPGKRPIQEKASKNIGDAVARKYDKSIKRQENPPSAVIKASSPVKPKHQKKEVSQKVVNRTQKTVQTTSHPTEVETKKSRDASKVLRSNKLKSASTNKPEKEQNFSNIQVIKIKGTTADTNVECFPTSKSSTGQKKNVEKEKKASEPSEILVESEIRINDFSVEPVSQTVPDVTEKLVISSQQVIDGEEKDISEDLGDCNMSAAYAGDSLVTLHPGREFKTNEGVHTAEKKRYERNNTMRNLLLGSASFLNHAEELFEMRSHQPTKSHTTSLHEYGTADSKALLECAKELLGNRCLQSKFRVQPVPNILIKESKIWLPLDQLVDEICDGIEYLRSYYKLGDKGLIVHKLHTVLQKDMWGKGVVNGAWDFGWSKGFTTPHEIDEVVINIEQHILTDLIEDMLRDLAV